MLTYQASYEAFGTRTAEYGSTADPQRANTKEEDPTGLLDEGMRYRDLATGEFITRDPLGFVDGPNLYAYVRQNPWTKFDPEGLLSFSGLGSGAVDVALEPFREVHDIALSTYVGINNAVSSQTIYSEDVRFASMLARGQQQRVNEGQNSSAVAIKGVAEVGVNIGTGGGYSVVRGMYENIEAYKKGQITLDQLDYNLSHIAGGQATAAITALALKVNGKPKAAANPVTTAREIQQISIQLSNAEGKTVGAITGEYNPNKSELFVDFIDVNPEFQDQGYSTKLYAAAIKQAKGEVTTVVGKAGGDNYAALEVGVPIEQTPRGRALSRLGFDQHEYDAATNMMKAVKKGAE